MFPKKQKILSEFHSISESDSGSSTDFEESHLDESVSSGINAPSKRVAGAVFKSQNDSKTLSVIKKAEYGRFNKEQVLARPNSSREILTLSLLEIFSPLLGEIEGMVQFSYMIDVKFLIAALQKTINKKVPVLILHGCDTEAKEIAKDASRYADVRVHLVKMPFPFGTHHSKMMIIKYKEGLRVVILTANLVQGDWLNRTQGVWMSPLLPMSVEDSDKSDSETHFKADLLTYLSSYHLPILLPWLNTIKSHNFSEVKAYFIMSAPGRYLGSDKNKWGHLQLKRILQQYNFAEGSVDWSVVAQCSSIGTLGSTASSWLTGEFKESLTACQNTLKSTLGISKSGLKLIFPSVEDVRKSYDGYLSGGSLPYSKFTDAKQPWLRSHMHNWSSDHRGRSLASPHIKTYTRLSPCNKRVSWFLMTSANLSKAAWGQLEKGGQQLFIRSYEVGVLLVPQQFDKNARHFNLIKGSSPGGPGELNLPYDTPLKPYNTCDRPWLWDKSYCELDTLGEKYRC